MASLTNEQQNVKNLFVRKILNINMLKIRKYHEVRDHCHYTGKYKGAPHGIYNLEYCIPKKVAIVFYNGSNYGYHFIMKASGII